MIQEGIFVPAADTNGHLDLVSSGNEGKGYFASVQAGMNAVEFIQVIREVLDCTFGGIQIFGAIGYKSLSYVRSVVDNGVCVHTLSFEDAVVSVVIFLHSSLTFLANLILSIVGLTVLHWNSDALPVGQELVGLT